MVYENFPMAEARLKTTIKRCRAQKSVTTLTPFTGGYQPYSAIVPSHESGV
jgi:hypothetical protein